MIVAVQADAADHLAEVVDILGQADPIRRQVADHFHLAVDIQESRGRIQFARVTGYRIDAEVTDHLPQVVDRQRGTPRSAQVAEAGHHAVAVDEGIFGTVGLAVEHVGRGADHVALVVDRVGPAAVAIGQGAEIGHAAVGPGEGVVIAVFRGRHVHRADDGAAVVDAVGLHVSAAGERAHRAAAVEEAVASPVGGLGIADDLPEIVDGVGPAAGAAEGADVGQAAVAMDEGAVHVAAVGHADHLAQVVDVARHAAGAGERGDGVARIGRGQQGCGQGRGGKQGLQISGTTHDGLRGVKMPRA